MTELLAPGGSVRGMKMAIAAGADAVYMGSTRFGARAYADNPDLSSYEEAIDLCHLNGRRLYMTVNTLLREDEIRGLLYNELEPLCRRGLDGVLVQDLGVLSFIRREFPLLPVHISTQMSVCGPREAKLLKKLGAVRVVPARELSLDELSAIREEAGIEVEAFVHGALCYCYSGRCLMSSLIGGRSGNRGRCAQPCRLPWSLRDGESGQEVKARGSHLMSLKDMCALPFLPDMLERHIDSLKIEGRMKAPEYAAGVTAVYRKYIDMYKECGRDGYRVDPEDMRILMDLYNRGGFSKGFFLVRNDPAMMTMDRPNHAGTPAARVETGKGGAARLRSLEDLHKGDELDVTGRGAKKRLSYVLPCDVPEGRVFTARLPGPVREGAVLPRVRSPHLMDALDALYDREPQRAAQGAFDVSPEGRLRLRVSCGAVSVCCEQGEVSEAVNAPTDEASVRRQLEKTGGSPFSFGSLSVSVPEHVFIPLRSVNELRRCALEKLREAVLAQFARDPAPREETPAPAEAAAPSPEAKEQNLEPAVCACVRTEGQLAAALRAPFVSRIILDTLEAPGQKRPDYASAPDRIHAAGRQVYLALPPIWREDSRERFQKRFSDSVLRKYDGFLVRSLGQIEDLAAAFPDKARVADACIYCWNTEAEAMLRRIGFTGWTFCAEQNARELSCLAGRGGEIVVRERTVLMLTASCLMKNTQRCRKKSAALYLTDRTGAVFPVITQCGECMNEIFNSLPTDLTVCMDEVLRLHPSALRLHFVSETEEECAALLDGAFRALRGEAPRRTGRETTRGHFRRGVE